MSPVDWFGISSGIFDNGTLLLPDPGLKVSESTLTPVLILNFCGSSNETSANNGSVMALTINTIVLDMTLICMMNSSC